MARKTRKELWALAKTRLNLEAISFLVRPIGANHTSKEVKFDEHDLDLLVETASKIKHIDITISEAMQALMDYYLTTVKPANSFITSFRFSAAIDSSDRHILKVFAAIQVNLEPKKSEQSDSLILGTKVPA